MSSSDDEMQYIPAYKYKCDICGMQFIKEDKYKQHMQTMHQQNKQQNNQNDVQQTELQNQDNLEEQEESQNQQNNQQEDQLTIYKCPHCNKTFTSKIKLDMHIQSAHKQYKYICKVCETHKRIHEGQITKTYICPICNGKFKQQYHLSRHMLTHQKKEQCSCQYCNRIFSTREQLQDHIKEIHSKDLE